LVTAARAFTIFLLDFFIHASSPTAFARSLSDKRCLGKMFVAAQTGSKNRGAYDCPEISPGRILES
jgi:hypothetical protein